MASSQGVRSASSQARKASSSASRVMSGRDLVLDAPHERHRQRAFPRWWFCSWRVCGRIHHSTVRFGGLTPNLADEAAPGRSVRGPLVAGCQSRIRRPRAAPLVRLCGPRFLHIRPCPAGVNRPGRAVPDHHGFKLARWRRPARRGRGDESDTCKFNQHVSNQRVSLGEKAFRHCCSSYRRSCPATTSRAEPDEGPGPRCRRRPPRGRGRQHPGRGKRPLLTTQRRHPQFPRPLARREHGASFGSRGIGQPLVRRGTPEGCRPRRRARP